MATLTLVRKYGGFEVTYDSFNFRCFAYGSTGQLALEKLANDNFPSDTSLNKALNWFASTPNYVSRIYGLHNTPAYVVTNAWYLATQK